MKVSQLLHAMDKDEEIIISENPLGDDLYNGKVRDIKRDNPINNCHIDKVFAYDDTLVILIDTTKGERYAIHRCG